jgi:hypothetical protein
MSYVLRGINVEHLHRKTICMAAASQDLFYDYEMLKYILQRENSSDLKFCVLGLAPYELWYDMSMSKETMARSTYYYPQVKTMHHYCYQNEEIAIYERNHRIYTQLMEHDLVDATFEEYRIQQSLFKNKDVQVWKLTDSDEEDAKAKIVALFDKPYEETFAENCDILERMMADLTARGIVPLIVIPPCPEIFKKYMDDGMLARTEEVFESLSKKYPQVIVLNYLQDADFDEYYFSDWSHLNYWGSNLLADKLNVILDHL